MKWRRNVIGEGKQIIVTKNRKTEGEKARDDNAPFSGTSSAWYECTSEGRRKKDVVSLRDSAERERGKVIEGEPFKDTLLLNIMMRGRRKRRKKEREREGERDGVREKEKGRGREGESERRGRERNGEKRL